MDSNILYSFNSLMQDGLAVPGGKRHEIKRILIPMIQRPYAQGRKSRRDIREKFIGEIFECITSAEAKPMELNFIYGTFNERQEFELLDGQQRLTTLFLLHWYIATKEGLRPECLNKFTYETRTSSTNFINKLVGLGIVLENTPSRDIRAAHWYSKSFDKDTTIDSMLRMLDCIDEHYKAAQTKPHYADLDRLRFYVLELSGFGLTEELFIKMNARGLQLTPFENFKADLIGYLKQQPRYHKDTRLTAGANGRTVPYWLYFSSMLDGPWQDMFWTRPAEDDFDNSGSKESDQCFFRFIQRYIAGKLIDPQVKNIISDESFLFFNENTEIERHGGFAPYRKVFEEALAANGFDFVRNIDKVLCFLVDDKVGETLLSSLKAPWEDELEWRPWSKDGVNRRRLILLSAMTEYIERVERPEAFDAVAYRQWMRIVHTLVENDDIRKTEDQITLTRLVKNILLFEDGVTAHPYSSLVAFSEARRQDNRVLDAEALKAKVILANPEWEDAFIEAERDKFLTGFVSFYYEDGIDIDTYRKRTSNVRMLFGAKGVAEHFRQDFRLMRAVIARNYDWTGVKKNAYYFTVTNDSSDRSLKAQTIWNSSESVKALLRSLLDCTTLSEMDSIIDSVAQEDHELLLRKPYWPDGLVARVRRAYKHLYQTDEMDALKWLYENPYTKSMSLYVTGTGLVWLYMGSVNCMVLSTNRHAIIPQLLERVNDFHLTLVDPRQVESFNKYRNYSGDVVRLSNDCLFSDSEGLLIGFDQYGILHIYLSSKAEIKDKSRIVAIHDAHQQYDAGQTYTKEGDVNAWIGYGSHQYQLLTMDYEEMSIDDIASVLRSIKEAIMSWNQ